MNEELIVICNTPSKTKLAKFFPKPLIYVNYMRLHRDSLNSRSVVNARKRILGTCGSLPDQFFNENTFQRISKIPLSTTAKSYSHIYSPALEPCRHHWDHIFFAATLHSGGCIWSPRCTWRSALWHMMSFITYNATAKQKPFNSKILNYSLFSKVGIYRPPSGPLPLLPSIHPWKLRYSISMMLYLKKYFLNPHSNVIITGQSVEVVF